MRPATALCLFVAFVIVAALSIYWYTGPIAPPATPEETALYGRGSAEMQRLAAAVKRYSHDQGSIPRSLADLVPRYLDAVPLDPWGRPYRYQTDGEKATLWFEGRDGESGPAVQPVDRDLTVFIRE